MKNRIKPQYPLRLLPSPLYRYLSLDSYFNDFFLIRYINKGPIPYDRSDIIEIATQIYDVSTFKNGMSMSLVSVYRKSDVMFNPSHDKSLGYDDSWNFDGARKPVVDNYEYKHRGFVGIKISDILNFRIPLIQENRNGVEESREFCLELGHYPTKCNFWHCMFYMREYVADGDPINLSVNYSNKKSLLLMEHAVGKIAELSVPAREVKEKYLLRSKFKQVVKDVSLVPKLLEYIKSKGGSISHQDLNSFLRQFGQFDQNSFDYFLQRINACNYNVVD